MVNWFVVAFGVILLVASYLLFYVFAPLAYPFDYAFRAGGWGALIVGVVLIAVGFFVKKNPYPSP